MCSVGSGLFIASRLPLTFVESRYFGASLGADYFAGKGVVGVGVEVSGECVNCLYIHQKYAEKRGFAILKQMLMRCSAFPSLRFAFFGADLAPRSRLLWKG